MLGAALDNGGLSGAEAIALIITAVATLITALGGFIIVFRRQNDTHRKIEQVYEHVNNVEDDQHVPGDEPTTLGQAVRQLRTESREGFARNDDVHELLQGMVEAAGTALRSHTGQIEVHRRELDDHKRRLRQVERDISLPNGEEK